ncbi:hypothetical protein GP484_06310 [Mammaliicoccus sciuri]|nr:hypothetical protein [Mammaliicoccus sciuri]MCD3219473.1 hypothetical protein [Mammaliicoccus sciuri]
MNELQTIIKAIILYAAVTVIEQLLNKKKIRGVKITSNKKGNSNIEFR